MGAESWLGISFLSRSFAQRSPAPSLPVSHVSCTGPCSTGDGEKVASLAEFQGSSWPRRTSPRKAAFGRFQVEAVAVSVVRGRHGKTKTKGQPVGASRTHCKKSELHGRGWALAAGDATEENEALKRSVGSGGCGLNGLG